MKDSENNPKKQHLLKLDNERLLLEKDITDITDYLCQDGWPGVDKPLIDEQGFPLNNLNLYEIREARNKLIRMQNDHKNLMLEIEKEMQEYFELEKSKNQEIREKKKYFKEEDTHLIQVFEDELETNKRLEIPFCYIQAVLENSPAQKAGFKEGDGIIYFGNVSGKTQNPLEKISVLVKSKINSEINVDIIRGNEKDVLKLKLNPSNWEGNGLLGCKLVLKL